MVDAAFIVESLFYPLVQQTEKRLDLPNELSPINRPEFIYTRNAGHLSARGLYLIWIQSSFYHRFWERIPLQVWPN